MIKTIVVPIDGSSHANKAVALAADIAGKYNARIVLLHVLLRDATATQLKQLARGLGLPAKTRKELDRLEEIPLESAAVAGDFAPIALPVPDKILGEVGALMIDKARKAAAAKGVKKIASKVVAGGAADSIVETAKKEKANMIVMGSRGLGNIRGLLLGSVSQKVSHLAECTCVTVK